MHVCVQFALHKVKQNPFEDFYILACENLAKVYLACKENYETLSSSPGY